MPQQVTAYTLSELKDAAPDAFERVHKEWAELCDEIPWADETMDSLKAVISACGARLKDWSVGPESHRSYLKVDADDGYAPDGDENADCLDKDAAWMLWEILTPLGYVKDGAADFPGHCKLTGYCADDDFLEATYKALQGGDTLTEALEGLAHDAARMMESDLEQKQDEDSMLANWGDRLYTIDGIEIG